MVSKVTPKRVMGTRGKTGARGPRGLTGARGPAGPSGGLSANHIELIRALRLEVQETIKDAEPVKALQQQVQGALRQADQFLDLRRQMEELQKEQRLQFVRIAQMQVQLDKLMGILATPPKS